MDKLAKLKMKKNVEGMKNASVECGELLNYIEKEVLLTKEMRAAFNNVIQHNRNMIKFFGILEQQLQK